MPKISVEEFENKVRQIERFPILIQMPRGTLVEDFENKIATAGNYTVAYWRDSHLIPRLPPKTTVFIGKLGNIPAPNMLLKTLRSQFKPE